MSYIEQRPLIYCWWAEQLAVIWYGFVRNTSQGSINIVWSATESNISAARTDVGQRCNDCCCRAPDFCKGCSYAFICGRHSAWWERVGTWLAYSLQRGKECKQRKHLPFVRKCTKWKPEPREDMNRYQHCRGQDGQMLHQNTAHIFLCHSVCIRSTSPFHTHDSQSGPNKRR